MRELYHKISENVKSVGLLFGSLILIIWLLISQICIVVLTSESIPYRLCLQVYNIPPKVGDICVFDYKGKKFLKYLVGTAGDKVRNINDNIYVGDFMVGKAEKNEILTPVSSGVIPEGYVFVAGTHPKSFDSRYKEFGFIKVSDFRGKAYGLIRW